MINKFYKRFINRIIFTVFSLKEKITGDKFFLEFKRNIDSIDDTNDEGVKFKLKMLNNLFEKNPTHPLLYYYKAFYNSGFGKNPETAYSDMKKYNSIRNEWMKKKS